MSMCGGPQSRGGYGSVLPLHARDWVQMDRDPAADELARYGCSVIDYYEKGIVFNQNGPSDGSC